MSNDKGCIMPDSLKPNDLEDNFEHLIACLKSNLYRIKPRLTISSIQIALGIGYMAAKRIYLKLKEEGKFKHLGISKRYAKKILDTPYLYYKNPNKDKLRTDIKFAPIPEVGYTKKQDNLFYYPEGLDKKVMVIGNSFGANLVEFLPYSFKYTARYYDNHRYMYLETYEEVFKEYKPDILIINKIGRASCRERV